MNAAVANDICECGFYLIECAFSGVIRWKFSAVYLSNWE
jgi:hypothetical protein